MSFNPKTYNLLSHKELGELWVKVYNYITPTPEEKTRQKVCYVPIGTKNQSQNIRFELHRFRAADRKQNGTPLSDKIVVKVVELEGDKPWGLKFENRGADLERMNLTAYDADGTPF